MNSSLRLELPGVEVSHASLPAALATSHRGTGETDPFLGPEAIKVRQVFDLSPTSRAAAAQPATIEIPDDVATLLALETATGETLFIHPGSLRDAGGRLDAMRRGTLRLDALQPDVPAGRNLGGFLWSKIWVLSIADDTLIARANKKIPALSVQWIPKLPVPLFYAGSSIGARALAWVVESRLLAQPDLYRWVEAAAPASPLAAVTDADLAAAANEGPLLVFIHGTASNTLGSFGDLAAAAPEWGAMRQVFHDRIFAFEHHTLSESPLDNALDLARRLPSGARLRFVTHSRGGLIGDLLCLHPLPAAPAAPADPGGAVPREALSDEEINAWRRIPARGVNAKELAAVTERERQLLRELRRLLRDKQFVIERYVRVACPARGTLLASANFDVFLSALLSIVGTVSGLRASGVYSGIARLVLEIARRRMDPQVIPGIEAMLPSAPLPALLSRAARAPGIQFSIIAGDIEGGSVWQRLGVLLTDWTFFARVNNDLVVDTDSMFEGLARDPLGGKTLALFDRGPRVNHFRYFTNPLTRKAIAGWLTPPEPDTGGFQEVPGRGVLAGKADSLGRSRAAAAPPPDGSRPVVIVLPGIMGSHLEVRSPGVAPGKGRRVWFNSAAIAFGAFAELEWSSGPGSRPIAPEGLFEMFYGDLCEFLARTHHVVRFAYDWRKPIQEEARRLAEEVERLLPILAGRQPIRLLAHSMGGLVCRSLIQTRPDLWAAIVKHAGGRFVMLGTPNHGSHLLVQHLVGKAGTTRNLARIDQTHDLQQIIDVAASLPGALQLLPRPDFLDTGARAPTNYFAAATWQDFKRVVRDRWFGDGVAAVPAQATLDLARKFWVETLTPDAAPEPHDRVAYVFGVAPETPCSVEAVPDPETKKTLRILVTPQGDGSVTWESGRLKDLPEDRHWWIAASHGDLTRTETAFSSLAELLEKGTTEGDASGMGLHRGLPPTTRGRPTVVPFEPGPPIPPTDEGLAAGLFGDPNPPIRRRPAARQRLAVSVTAGDLRFAQKPVICGHYRSDPIAGPEDILDRDVVQGGLRQRERLGLYPDDIGTSTSVLLPVTTRPNGEVIRQGTLVVGLGDFGKLNTESLAETVRAGVLRLLIRLHEFPTDADGGSGSTDSLKLAPLLLGHNSTTSIGIEDSLAAVVRGVITANRQFGEAIPDSPLRVVHLEFTELFVDTAMSAAHAVRGLPVRLKAELTQVGVILEPASELNLGDGARPRLAAAGAGADPGYWPRILVTDADQAAVECPAECYEIRRVSPLPPELLRLLSAAGRDAKTNDAPPASLTGSSSTRIAERLRYLYLSQRAQAETVVHQRQPQLIEQLVASAIHDPRHDPELGRLFFELMVPVAFKETARNLDRVVLVVDGATANFPWEMMIVMIEGEEKPLVTRARVVRQLASSRSLSRRLHALADTALVIGNPSTEGFGKVFPGYPDLTMGLPSLPGAEREAANVAHLLDQAGYDVKSLGTQPDDQPKARQVLSTLLSRPHRILHLAAHGIFGLAGKDGQPRSGIVLSDGLLLSAAEVGLMTAVPELVFLNCCHLAQADALPRETGRLAYSLARELIEMGVRCVIAAGWEVNDAAADLFATRLYGEMVGNDSPFGEAVLLARRAVWEDMRHCNTWGAYQAYGDPAFRLGRVATPYGPPRSRSWVSPIELAAEITVRAFDLSKRLTTDESPAGAARAHPAHLAQLLASRNVPSAFVNHPDVQAAIGRFYSELGDFAKATAAYEQALQAPDPSHDLTLATLERLANLEARHGEGTHNLPLVQRALRRIEGLLALGSTEPLENALHANPERLSLYGSALKRRAALAADEFAAQASAGQPSGTVLELLKRARDAYGLAMGQPGTPDFEPYPATNYLQLALLTRALPSDLALLARQITDAAQERFQRQPSIHFDIVPIDVDLTLALRQEGELARRTREFVRRYQDTRRRIPVNARQWDSITRQFLLLARLGRSVQLDSRDIEALHAIGRELSASGAHSPPTPPASPGDQPAVEGPPPAGPVPRPPAAPGAAAAGDSKPRRRPRRRKSPGA